MDQFLIGNDNEKAKCYILYFQTRIAAQLIPSAIFAAVPRTPTNLSKTWPRRSPSPIAQAIGEVGNVGRVPVGDISKRPPADLPPDQGDRKNTHDEERAPDDSEIEEDDEYESVPRSQSFDKTTKYFRHMSREEDSSGGAARDEVKGATGEGSTSQQPFYHILDHEHDTVVEPVYSRVHKKRKSESKQPDDGFNDEVWRVEHDVWSSCYSVEDFVVMHACK